MIRVVTITAPAQPPDPDANDAGAYDLVDLDTVKDELQIDEDDTSNDTFLERAITQESTTVHKFCNRVFPIEGLTEDIYVDREAMPITEPPILLQLTRWPLANVVTLPTSADTLTGAELPFTNTTEVTVGGPVSGVGVPPGTTVASIAANASVTLSQAITADIPQTTPITFGLAISTTTRDGTVTPLVRDADFRLDLHAGTVTRLNSSTLRPRSWETTKVTVAYYAGYDPIPPDISYVASQLVVARFYGRKRDPFLKAQDEPGLGRQEFWVGGPPKSGAIPEDLMGRIENYRVPVVR